MSEAWGTMIIKADKEIVDSLGTNDDEISWDTMSKLFNYAGIESLKDSHELLHFHEGNSFPHEGLNAHKDYIEVTIFGAEWMQAMKPLTLEGKDIELYGRISDEYGGIEYYSLASDGTRFYECVDMERDEGADDESTMTKWINSVPKEFRKYFEDD